MRSRNIKPGFFKNEDLAKLEPHCRLLFAGLWGLADREGRLEDRPDRIRAELFPYEVSLDVHRYLTELSRLNFIIRYRIGKQSYIQVTAWKEHQSPHNTEKKSEIPEYVEGVSAITVNTPLRNGEYPPDSLIPDSLPSLRSGKVSESREELPSTPKNQTVSKKDKRAAAERVLDFLNQKAHRAFQPTDVNLEFILARFEEGYTEVQCRQVVAKKLREWIDDERMAKFIRPATLFNREKFNQYAGELVVPVEGGA